MSFTLLSLHLCPVFFLSVIPLLVNFLPLRQTQPVVSKINTLFIRFVDSFGTTISTAHQGFPASLFTFRTRLIEGGKSASLTMHDPLFSLWHSLANGGVCGYLGKTPQPFGGKGNQIHAKNEICKSGFRSVWDLDFPSVKASFCQGM